MKVKEREISLPSSCLSFFTIFAIFAIFAEFAVEANPHWTHHLKILFFAIDFP